jgi:pimeloyl-ACP methyl ester carboxylesterase
MAAKRALRIFGTSSLIAILLLVAWAWTPDLDRAVLEALYAGPPSEFVDAAGARVHVRVSGPSDAPVVVMIHGFGASLHTWEQWAEVLSRTHRVIRYDLTGGGLTGPDPTGDYTDTRAMQVLAALMDHYGAGRASLVGHSIGGRLAWRFAGTYPDRVHQLVLVAPDGFASPGFEYGKRTAVPAVLGLMRHFLPKAVLRMNLEPAYGDPSRLSDDVVQRYHDLMRGPGVRDALFKRLEQTILEDPTQFIAGIRAPTLLVWGESDSMIPVTNAQDYLRRMPDARLVAFPGLGHVPHEESPAPTVVPVRDFLNR